MNRQSMPTTKATASPISVNGRAGWWAGMESCTALLVSTLVNGFGGRRAARAAANVDGLSHGGGRKGGSPSGMADPYRPYENNTRT